jgi:HEAT repeat protein
MMEIDEVVKKLDSADEAERIYAAEDIGYANRPEGIAPLLARLPAEDSRAVREAIFGALQSIDNDAVTEGAIELLSSEDSFVRNQAVELLRQRGPKVIPYLSRTFSSARKDQRKMVIDVLAGMDGPGSAEIYDRALADGDLNVVITAVEGLGNAGKTEFRERIEDLAAAGDPMLAGACLEALARIGNVHSLDAIRSRVAAGGASADFLLPSYLRVLGAHGDEHSITEAAGILESHGSHLHAPILDAIARLRHRHPTAPLPQSLFEPLRTIIQSDHSSHLRHQALSLMHGLVRFEETACFLAEYPGLDLEFVALPVNSRV